MNEIMNIKQINKIKMKKMFFLVIKYGLLIGFILFSVVITVLIGYASGGSFVWD
jgi:hypothetical protein